MTRTDYTLNMLLAMTDDEVTENITLEYQGETAKASDIINYEDEKHLSWLSLHIEDKSENPDGSIVLRLCQ